MPNSAEGNWNEYAKLVLAELERHNKMLAAIEAKVDEVKLEQALQEREAKRVNDELVKIRTEINTTTIKLQGDIDSNRNKIKTFTETDIADQAVRKYRKYIIGAIFGFIVFLIPNAIKVGELVAKSWG